MDNALQLLDKTDGELLVGNHIVEFGKQITPATRLDSGYTGTGRLLETVGGDPVGYADMHNAKITDKGVFVQRVLSRRKKYLEFLEELLRQGAIVTAPEAVAGKAQKAGVLWAYYPLKADRLFMNNDATLDMDGFDALKRLAGYFPSLQCLVDNVQFIRRYR